MSEDALRGTVYYVATLAGLDFSLVGILVVLGII